MKEAFDLHSIRRILRHGVEKGLWTLEALDTPSSGFRNCTAVDRKTFIGGYEGVQHRNLLRDDSPAPTQANEAPAAAPAATSDIPF